MTSRTDELIRAAAGTPAGTGTALRGVSVVSGVSGQEGAANAADGLLTVERRAQGVNRADGVSCTDGAGRGDGSGYEVRCPHCHALQFLARERWESVAIDEATVAIKCWRRTCKVVLGLRPAGAICPQTPESGQEVRV